MFKDRKEAGKQLAEKLEKYTKKKDVLILAIPRGGIEVAYEVSKALNVPLDIIVVKKIGYPGEEEFAIGAATANNYYINEDTVKGGHVSEEYVKEQIKIKQGEAKAAYSVLKGNKPPYDIKNKTIILIDDGIATGATMLMAIGVIKKQNPKEIIVATPVAPPEVINKLKKEADEVVCLLEPELFMAIGQFYENFPQVENEQAKRYLS